MITIVKFFAFSQLQTHIFYKGESPAMIRAQLDSICSTNIVCEILQGEMQNKPLSFLNP